MPFGHVHSEGTLDDLHKLRPVLRTRVERQDHVALRTELLPVLEQGLVRLPPLHCLDGCHHRLD